MCILVRDGRILVADLLSIMNVVDFSEATTSYCIVLRSRNDSKIEFDSY